jgi:hypothetical protein
MLPLPARVNVTGVSYRQGVVALLKVGEAVYVKRDINNPYDSNACLIVNSFGEELGFVPKSIAPRLSSRPERFWFGKVIEVFAGDLVGVKIEISEKELLVESNAQVEREVTKKVYWRGGSYLGELSKRSDLVVWVLKDKGEFAYPLEFLEIK